MWDLGRMGLQRGDGQHTKEMKLGRDVRGERGVAAAAAGAAAAICYNTEKDVSERMMEMKEKKLASR